MGVTSLSYNPKKDIIATGSDDTTWKLWSVPNGDLIMSGEGHVDWVGGVEFHPKGNLLATASGDGTVKIWDFVRAQAPSRRGTRLNQKGRGRSIFQIGLER